MNSDRWFTTADVEGDAKSAMDPRAWAYLSEGAGTNKTVEDNVAAFGNFWCIPRLRRDSHTTLNTRVSILGQELATPMLVAPTSPQRLFHKDAEIATASAAAKCGTVSIVSTNSHYSFAEIVTHARQSCWFQLYAYRERADVEALLEMAVQSGAKTIVVTMDAHYPARRFTALKAGFQMPPFVEMGNLKALGIHPSSAGWDGRLSKLPLTWEDLSWIRSQLQLPLFVKGVLHAADARRCVDIGADGVIVSNHGGRQMDSAIPSILALKDVVAAVRDECVVLMDSGIRSGSDVVKALALGAHAVCVGRPCLWGLAVDGEAGMTAVLRLLQAELEDALLQLGLNSIAELTSDCITSVSRARCDFEPFLQNGRRN
jgi:4-hydroxymandelate oxidase